MKDFVTFEIAKKLKEKGFKEKCVAYYWISINEHTPSFLVEDNMPDEGICIIDLLSEHNKAEWSPFIDTTTIYQVLKWLREKKKLHVSIMTFMFRAGWCYEVIRLGDNPELVAAHSNSYNTYEKAAIAGIQYVIDNLI